MHEHDANGWRRLYAYRLYSLAYSTALRRCDPRGREEGKQGGREGARGRGLRDVLGGGEREKAFFCLMDR